MVKLMETVIGTPEDKDADGTKDFLQYSENAVVTTQPIDAVRQGGDDAEFSVTVMEMKLLSISGNIAMMILPHGQML